eukprot:scaffold3068_cov401-Prasinococcus_capsulatus_cf.AAC.35
MLPGRPLSWNVCDEGTLINDVKEPPASIRQASRSAQEATTRLLATILCKYDQPARARGLQIYSPCWLIYDLLMVPLSGPARHEQVHLCQRPVAQDVPHIWSGPRP